MKNNELVFRHKISNNKVVFYLMACAFAIIISLGVSAKCSAALSDLVYIYNQPDYELGRNEYYYKKYNYEDILMENPDSIEKRYTQIPELCVSYKSNEFGEDVHIHPFDMYYGDQYRQPVAIIMFCAYVINNETTNCEIWINGEFEDTVKLGRNNTNIKMIGKLPIERFSKAGDYKIEVIVEGIDGKKMVASVLIRVSRPYIPPETSLINKIENTSNNTGLKVEWDDLGAVNSYYVYRAKEKDGLYKLMGITYEPYLIDEDVEAGQKYWYRVVANFSNDEKFQSADVEGSLKPIESLAADNNGQTINKSKTDRNTKLNKPKISIKKKRRNWQIYWGIISDKSIGIDVYMKNGYGKYKKYRKINTTTKLKKSKNKKGAVGITSSRKSLVKGVKYQFKARTFYYKKNGRKVYSKWSNVIKLKG